MLAADILGCGAHGRCDGLSGGVQEKLGETFKDHLDLDGIRFREVVDGERDADVGYAAYDFFVGKAEESVRHVFFLAGALLCVGREDGHSRVEGHGDLCAVSLRSGIYRVNEVERWSDGAKMS